VTNQGARCVLEKPTMRVRLLCKFTTSLPSVSRNCRAGLPIRLSSGSIAVVWLEKSAISIPSSVTTLTSAPFGSSYVPISSRRISAKIAMVRTTRNLPLLSNTGWATGMTQPRSERLRIGTPTTTRSPANALLKYSLSPACAWFPTALPMLLPSSVNTKMLAMDFGSSDCIRRSSTSFASLSSGFVETATLIPLSKSLSPSRCVSRLEATVCAELRARYRAPACSMWNRGHRTIPTSTTKERPAAANTAHFRSTPRNFGTCYTLLKMMTCKPRLSDHECCICPV
jgi:hypothetical protein